MQGSIDTFSKRHKAVNKLRFKVFLNCLFILPPELVNKLTDVILTKSGVPAVTPLFYLCHNFVKG